MKFSYGKSAAAIAALVGASVSGAAMANGEAEQCFDKGTLTYFDCPTPEEPITFTGFRLGVNVGYAWGDVDAPLTDDGDFVNNEPYDVEGELLGISAGYDVDFGTIVVGVEGDFEHSGVDGDDEGRGGDVNGWDSDWLASARARAGFKVLPETLVYGTGGVEWQGGKAFALDDIDGDDKSGETLMGYTIGGGVEHMVDQSLSLRIEYRYTDYEAESSAMTNNGYDQETDLDQHAVRAGVGFRF